MPHRGCSSPERGLLDMSCFQHGCRCPGGSPGAEVVVYTESTQSESFSSAVRSRAAGMGVLGEAYGYALTAPLDELKDSASVRGRTRRRTQSLQGVGSEQPAPEFIPDSAAAHRALVKEKQGKVTELQLKSEELAKSQSLVEADIAALRVIWQAARAEDLEDRPNVERAAMQLEAAQSQIERWQSEIERRDRAIDTLQRENEHLRRQQDKLQPHVDTEVARAAQIYADKVAFSAAMIKRRDELTIRGTSLETEASNTHSELEQAVRFVQLAEANAHFTPMKACAEALEGRITELWGNDEGSAVINRTAAEITTFVTDVGLVPSEIIEHDDAGWAAAGASGRKLLADRVIRIVLLRKQGRCAGPRGDGVCNCGLTSFAQLSATELGRLQFAHKCAFPKDMVLCNKGMGGVIARHLRLGLKEYKQTDAKTDTCHKAEADLGDCTHCGTRCCQGGYTGDKPRPPSGYAEWLDRKKEKKQKKPRIARSHGGRATRKQYTSGAVDCMEPLFLQNACAFLLAVLPSFLPALVLATVLRACLV
eukprot:COSAG06_NODE_1384_length_9620_cov_216.881525_3_plen_536_part_00